MNDIPGMIMGFREGLEAFLVVAIILRYLSKLNLNSFKKYAYYGVGVGVVVSFALGMFLNNLGDKLGNKDTMTKFWESGASLAALVLVTTFIIWMIKNGRTMTEHVENSVKGNLSKTGIFLVSTVMVAREGVEVSIFTFAGNYTFISILIGLGIALVLTILIIKSLIKVNLSTIFKITLVYLIIQAGYLLGYGIHEGLAALKTAGYIGSDSFLLVKLFDLSKTMLNHKEGVLGFILNVLLGWYSKPEWLQFVCQYAYTGALFIFMKSKWKN